MVKDYVNGLYTNGASYVGYDLGHVRICKRVFVFLIVSNYVHRCTFIKTRHPFYSFQHHVSDKVDHSLPTLEDLGVTPEELEDRMPWVIVPYERYKFDVTELQQVTPLTVKTLGK